MARKLFVSNLSYSMTDIILEHLFAPHGSVCNVEVITDADSGLSKGVGYVKMGSDAEALSAIASLQGHVIDGRAMIITLAKSQDEQSPLPPRYGNGRSGGGGGRNGRAAVSESD